MTVAVSIKIAKNRIVFACSINLIESFECFEFEISTRIYFIYLKPSQTWRQKASRSISFHISWIFWSCFMASLLFASCLSFFSGSSKTTTQKWFRFLGFSIYEFYRFIYSHWQTMYQIWFRYICYWRRDKITCHKVTKEWTRHRFFFFIEILVISTHGWRIDMYTKKISNY